MVAVAPFTGAWIETVNMADVPEGGGVAPFTGAWIETAATVVQSPEPRVALHGRVD